MIYHLYDIDKYYYCFVGTPTTIRKFLDGLPVYGHGGSQLELDCA